MKVFRYLLALTLLTTAILFPSAAAMSPDGAESSADAGTEAVSPVVGTVTGFGELEMDEIGMVEKYDLDTLLAMMPETCPVYLDGSDTVTEIPVTWYSVSDYENSRGYYFQFSPSWDLSLYPLSPGMDVELDAPYIAVYIAQPELRTLASNAPTIFRYLVGELRLNSAAACGILANMYAESGFNPTDGCTDTNGKTSYGLCQWNGSRYTNLKNYCKQNGYNYTTIEGQLHFLGYELSTKTYGYIYQYMLTVDNTAAGAYDAGYYWCYYFERPANTASRSRERGNLAKNTYWPTYGNADLAGSDAPLLIGATYPALSMEYGTYFTLRGELSSVSKMTSVTAGVYTSTGKSVTSASAVPNSTSYDLYKLDDKVLFSQVPAGSYHYRVTATAGKTQYTVVDYAFTVTPRRLADGKITLSKTSCPYTGTARTPQPSVTYGKTTLVKGQDYTLSYTNNVNAGKATCTVTGKGNYSGTFSQTFTITPLSLDDATLKLSAASFAYTGAELKPKPIVVCGSVTLTDGTDFTTAYQNNVNTGTATVTITGSGNCKGTLQTKFTIVARKLSSVSVEQTESCPYTGVIRTPSAQLSYGKYTLKNGTDYTISYKNNLNSGTATCTIKGKGRFTGTLQRSFTITPRDLSDADITLASACTYTGTNRTPSPVIKYRGTLRKGTDYTVSYRNNKIVGVATCTITGKGNFTGRVNRTFTIVPAKVTKLAAKSSASGVAQVTWETLRYASGYQIQYDTRSDFADAQRLTLYGAKNSRKNLGKLVSGKTYYVRMRTFRKMSGKNYYSSYCAPVRVKIA